MKRRAAILAIYTMLLLSLTSCWDRRELDTLGIVGALGIDTDEAGVLVSAQILRTCSAQPGSSQGSGGGDEPISIVRAGGRTVFEAIRSLSRISSRRPYFPHTQVIVIGEDAAKRGLQGILDFIARDMELRPRTNIIVCRGKASDFLNADSGFGRVPAFAYRELVENRGATSQVSSAMFAEFAGKMLTDHTAVITTLAETFVAEREAEASNPPSATPKEPSSLSPDKGIIRFRLIGSAVFKGLKMVGTLDLDETRGHQWVSGKVDSGIIVLPNVDAGGKVSIEIVSAQGKVRPVTGEDGKLMLNLVVKVEGSLGEQETLVNQSTPEGLERLSKELEREIRTEIELALGKARELRADIFGFGELVRRFSPEQWKTVGENWTESFATVPINIEIEARLLRFGVITSGGGLR